MTALAGRCGAAAPPRLSEPEPPRCRVLGGTGRRLPGRRPPPSCLVSRAGQQLAAPGAVLPGGAAGGGHCCVRSRGGGRTTGNRGGWRRACGTTGTVGCQRASRAVCRRPVSPARTAGSAGRERGGPSGAPGVPGETVPARAARPGGSAVSRCPRDILPPSTCAASLHGTGTGAVSGPGGTGGPGAGREARPPCGSGGTWEGPGRPVRASAGRPPLPPGPVVGGSRVIRILQEEPSCPERSGPWAPAPEAAVGVFSPAAP